MRTFFCEMCSACAMLGTQWREVSAKFVARVRDVAAYGAAWPTRTRFFGIHCTGLIRYRVPFALPDRELVRAYWVAPRTICVVPWMAFPPARFHNTGFLVLPASVLRVDRQGLQVCAMGGGGTQRRVEGHMSRFRRSEARRRSGVRNDSWHFAPSSLARLHLDGARFLHRGSDSTEAAAAAALAEDATQQQWIGVPRLGPALRRAVLEAVLRRHCARWGPERVDALAHSLASYANTEPPPE